MTPIDEFAALEKTAFNWAHPAVGVASAVAAPLVVTGIAAGLGAAKDAIVKARGFRQMVERNPELQDQPAALVKERYNSLYRISPTIMSDPVSAGGIMRGLDTYGGMLHPNAVKELADAENKMHRPLSPMMNQLMSSTTQAMANMPASFMAADRDRLKAEDMLQAQQLARRKATLEQAKFKLDKKRFNRDELSYWD